MAKLKVNFHPCSIKRMYKMQPIPANIRRLSAAYRSYAITKSAFWIWFRSTASPILWISLCYHGDAHWTNVKKRLGFWMCRIKSHLIARFVLRDNRNDPRKLYFAYLDKVKGIKAQNHWKCESWPLTLSAPPILGNHLLPAPHFFLLYHTATGVHIKKVYLQE